MAENGGGKSNTLIYVVLALVVAWFIYQAVAKKAEKITTSTAGAFGKGVGSGATSTLIKEGSSAIGSFLGGLFGSKKPGTSAHDSEDTPDDEGGYDISQYRSALEDDEA